MTHDASGLTSDDAEALRARVAELEEEREAACELLSEAGRQITYLHERFKPTGSGEAVLMRIEVFLGS